LQKETTRQKCCLSLNQWSLREAAGTLFVAARGQRHAAVSADGVRSKKAHYVGHYETVCSVFWYGSIHDETRHPLRRRIGGGNAIQVFGGDVIHNFSQAGVESSARNQNAIARIICAQS